MSSAVAAGPVRTCAGCGRKAAQHELQRFHQRDGTLVRGPGEGRGVYTCRRLSCFERANSHRGFNRTLRRNVRVEPDLARLYTESTNPALGAADCGNAEEVSNARR